MFRLDSTFSIDLVNRYWYLPMENSWYIEIQQTWRSRDLITAICTLEFLQWRKSRSYATVSNHHKFFLFLFVSIINSMRFVCKKITIETMRRQRISSISNIYWQVWKICYIDLIEKKRIFVLKDSINKFWLFFLEISWLNSSNSNISCHKYGNL